jgi:hypothetical protein
MSIWSGALTLSCDECARSQYNHLPGSYRVLPLSEYRDWYAEARSQMQDAVTVVTAEVIDDASARAAAPSPPPIVPQAAAIPARGPAPAPAAAAGGPPPSSSPGAPAAGPGKKMSRRAARTLLGGGIAVTACVIVGVFLITWGNHLASRDGTYSNALWSFWGVVFILMPLWAGIGWVVTEVVKFSAQQHRRYREWKASLTPQQRAAAGLAEAAAMTVAAVAMRKRHKRTDARLTSSVMGYTMPDGHTMQPSDRLASYRQRAAMRHPAPQQAWGAPDPTAASQQAIARSRPHLVPETRHIQDAALVRGKNPTPLTISPLPTPCLVLRLSEAVSALLVELHAQRRGSLSSVPSG